MKFKLGDRVVVKHSVARNITGGRTGVVTANSPNMIGEVVGVTLDDKETQFKEGRIYFSSSELELDKSYIINEILKEI